MALEQEAIFDDTKHAQTHYCEAKHMQPKSIALGNDIKWQVNVVSPERSSNQLS